MPTTPIFSLPYPNPTDPADGPAGFQNLATATETAINGRPVPLTTKLADQVKASPGLTFDFLSIPQTFASLAIDLNLRAEVAGPQYVTIVFNNTPGGNAYSRMMVSLGAAYAGQFLTNQAAGDVAAIAGSTDWGGYFSPYRIWVPEYTKTRAQTFTSQGVFSPTAHVIHLFGGMWTGTTAINRVTLTASANLAVGSRATLYGFGTA